MLITEDTDSEFEFNARGGRFSPNRKQSRSRIESFLVPSISFSVENHYPPVDHSNSLRSHSEFIHLLLPFRTRLPFNMAMMSITEHPAYVRKSSEHLAYISIPPPDRVELDLQSEIRPRMNIHSLFFKLSSFTAEQSSGVFSSVLTR
jgi:hypothetical protein